MPKTVEQLTIELKSEKKKHADEIKDFKEKLNSVNSKEEADKDEIIKSLKSELSELQKSNVENRVGKIHSTYKKFVYKDQNIDYLDGFIDGMKIKTKENANGVIIPKIETKKTTKSGFHVENETGLTKEGDQI